MAVNVLTKTFSGSAPVELDDTTSGADSLYNDLINIGPTTYVGSSYAVMEKGDVTATVLYSERTGGQLLRCKEFADRRSLGGATAYTFAGWTGQAGEPTLASSGAEFVYAINNWLDDNATSLSALVIKNVHFRIDSTGQKRALFIYDNVAESAGVLYYAKLYSDNRRALSNNGSETAYEYIYGYGYGYGTGLNYFDITEDSFGNDVDGTTVGYGITAFETAEAWDYGYGYGWEQVSTTRAKSELTTDIAALQDAGGGNKTVSAAFINQEFDPSGRRHVLVIYRTA